MKRITSIASVLVSVLTCLGCVAETQDVDTGAQASQAAQASRKRYGFELLPERVAPGALAAAATPPAAAQPGGRLAPEEIRRVVRERLDAMGACYEGARKGDPALAGQVVVSFHIREDGSVHGAAASSPSIQDGGLLRCFEAAAGSLAFPTSEAGAIEVIYPFELDPTPAPAGG